MTIHFTYEDLEVLVVDVAEKMQEKREGRDLSAVELFVLARTAVEATLKPFIDSGAMIIAGDRRSLAQQRVPEEVKRGFLAGFREAIDPDG